MLLNIDICLIGIQYVKDTHQCGQDYVKFCGFGGISVDIGAKSAIWPLTTEKWNLNNNRVRL
jgi:hypothetical protein